MKAALIIAAALALSLAVSWAVAELYVFVLSAVHRHLKASYSSGGGSFLTPQGSLALGLYSAAVVLVLYVVLTLVQNGPPNIQIER